MYLKSIYLYVVMYLTETQLSFQCDTLTLILENGPNFINLPVIKLIIWIFMAKT